ncbi:GNAT family N-acetyltransferase [Falsibacillus albus]|uniref:GNAT family N-acetyltransferase n=1 Tax=Falsibacillus albus TaxID=2478915 RepID=A0A3L7K374_9BACI|nr:GNAT family N-acetyltransferase [Falsibacillus albus]RLQ97503.1 GNAT family N-acetyltransferase [Falsibacillus albus]
MVMIRKAAVEDLMPLKELMLQYIVDFYKRPKPDENELNKLILAMQSNPSIGEQFVAIDGDSLIGFATLYYTFSTTRVKKMAILNDLFVSAKHRGCGAGEALFRQSRHRAHEADCASMTWQTALDNKRAQSLYEKMGGQNVNDCWIHYEIDL